MILHKNGVFDFRIYAKLLCLAAQSEAHNASNVALKRASKFKEKAAVNILMVGAEKKGKVAPQMHVKWL